MHEFPQLSSLNCHYFLWYLSEENLTFFIFHLRGHKLILDHWFSSYGVSKCGTFLAKKLGKILTISGLEHLWILSYGTFVSRDFEKNLKAIFSYFWVLLLFDSVNDLWVFEIFSNHYNHYKRWRINDFTLTGYFW